MVLNITFVNKITARQSKNFKSSHYIETANNYGGSPTIIISHRFVLKLHLMAVFLNHIMHLGQMTVGVPT